MGTSGSYSGSGGNAGKGVRKDVRAWIDSLPSSDSPPATAPEGGSGERQGPDSPARPKLDPNALLPMVGLIRPRSPRTGGGDGPGGGGGRRGGSSGGRGRGGGPARTAAASARTAGRAAAAAYAYRTGDTATLDRLGLRYADLSELGDSVEITRRIVEAACDQTSNSTIEDHEQRLVAAEVAEWVLTESSGDRAPSPEEIVRHTIAHIIAEVGLSETGVVVNNSEHSGIAEQEVRDAADALAARTDLSADGIDEVELANAIERGIETLREILEKS